MKITFTLKQINEFSKLSRKEQQVVVKSLNELAAMDDTAIETVTTDESEPSLVMEVKRQAVKRVKASRYRRARKEAAAKTTVEEPTSHNFEGEVKHEIRTFERKFKDDFQLLVTRHVRVLKKAISNAPEEVKAEALSYAHGYMRRTLMANVPKRYRAERIPMSHNYRADR